ncbi:DUF3617 domain-containing protein [Sphingosinicella sp. YJ22]|uniref:DUF3617 domain-containing protein n=1 Tax=Sphingosinicella sp. YJ22 TaxID=1104780 RepID=UPI00140D39FF|nr:DUF3617 domain-containing protein [Sphingosinicella sp. YJ22]
MKRLAIPALLSTSLLAGCGGESTVLEPGQWDMNVAITKMEAPGLPQGANVPLPPPQTVSQCLTPEQARNPGADFAGGGQQGCTSDDYRMADGRISGTIQCNQQGTSMRATVAGTYTRDSMDMTMNSETQASGQNVNTEVRVTGRRTGECRS